MSKSSLTAAQAKTIDRIALERCGLSTIVLMENAGAAVARHACSFKPSGPIVIICGKGNNAGDGFVAARHLAALGRKTDVYCISAPDALTGPARVNAMVLQRCGQKISVIGEKTLKNFGRRVSSSGLIIDALFGVGLDRPVTGIYRSIIEQINAARTKVLAVDIPSGLNATTGRVWGICVKAAVTVTFIARKSGMLKAAGHKMCGRIIVEPIGFPAYNKGKLFHAVK